MAHVKMMTQNRQVGLNGGVPADSFALLLNSAFMGGGSVSVGLGVCFRSDAFAILVNLLALRALDTGEARMML